MLTYLVAFAIGKFDHIESRFFGERLRIRAFTPEGKSEQAKFALDTAIKAIALMEDYFGIPFPLKKIDMLTGIENIQGGTEGWGLITFEESLFLCNEDTLPRLTKGYIAKIIIHELSHQWFGNLITIKWWNDLWLKEGFAAWMEGYMIDKMYPELKWDQEYTIPAYQKALTIDAQDGTHPISVSEAGRDIANMLDELAYHKSGALINLIHDDYVGPDIFRFGIQRLLSKYKERNFEASDLWRILGAVSGLPVDCLIKSWTKIAGHPLITIKLLPDNSKRIILEQNRELSMEMPSENNLIHQNWIIPVKILLSDGIGMKKTIKVNLDRQRLVVQLPYWFDLERKENLWLKVNENSRGFYRVHYDDETLLKRLERPCRTKDLDKDDRIGLINDLSALYWNNIVKREQLSEVLEWFTEETDSSVLRQVAYAVADLRLRSDGLLEKSQVDSLAKKLFVPVYESVGLTSVYLHSAGAHNGQGMMDSLGPALSALIEANHRPIIDEALALFDKKAYRVPSRIRDLVYQAVALYGTLRQKQKLKFILSSRDII